MRNLFARITKNAGGDFFRPALVLLVLVILPVFICCGSPETKKMKFYNKGQALYANSEYEKAQAQFENALLIDSKFADAHYMLGMIRRARGELREAYISFSQALGVDSAHMKARLRLGEILLIGGHPDEAMENIKMVLAGDPENTEARLLEAEILLFVNDAEKAATRLEELVSNGAGEPELFLLMAKARLLEGDAKKAEDALLRGITANDNSIELRRMLSDVYRSELKMGEAVEQVRRMIAIEPGNHDHKIELAVLCWDAGLVGVAHDILAELLSSLQGDEKTWLKVAGFLVSRGAYEEAESVLKQGVEREGKALTLRLALADLYKGAAGAAGLERAAVILEEVILLAKDVDSPEATIARLTLADIHLARGEPHKASARVEEVLRKDPGDIDARRMRGHILLIKGDGAGATSEFQSVVKERPEDLRAYLLLAQSLMIEGKETDALSAIHAAFRLNPQSAEVCGALVRYHALRGEFETAQAYLLEAIKEGPDNLEMRAELGDLYIAWNNPRKAEIAYEEIKKIAPAHPLGYLKMGHFLAARKEWDRAAREYRMAIDRNPLDLGVYLLLGECYTQGRQYEKAKETYLEALRRQPDFAPAQRELSALN